MTATSPTSAEYMAAPDRVLLAGLIPEARLKIYPDAAHGFLFQRHAEFAADVDAFLAGT